MMEYDWGAILERGETQNVDFKGPLSWDDDHKADLARDIVAMANTRNGGMIVLGVEEEDGTRRPRIVGMTDGQVRSFDPSAIGQYVNARFRPRVRLSVEKPVVEGKQLVVVQVSEFEESPLICAKREETGGKIVFDEGWVLARAPTASTQKVDAEAMAELIGRAVTRRGDQLLEQIRRLIKGEPLAPEPGWKEEFAPELDRWVEIEREFRTARPKKGTWSFLIVPTRVPPLQPMDHVKLHDLIRRSTVDRRGWPIPCYHPEPSQPEGLKNVMDGVEVRMDSEPAPTGHEERSLLFRRLVFGHVRVLWEDHEGRFPNVRPGEVLSYPNAIYTIAEWVLFAKNLMEEAGYDGPVLLRTHMTGCKGRKLTSATPALHDLPPADFTCAEPMIEVQRTVDTVGLSSGWEEIAAEIGGEILSLFNLDRPIGGTTKGLARVLVERLRDRNFPD